MRFVVGIDADDIVPALRRHLDAHGFSIVEIRQPEEISRATRLDPDDAWVGLVSQAIERTAGSRPTILPNLGGTLPNDIFADVLGLRTIWTPHTYRGCSQHGLNEHVPLDLVQDALRIKTGLYWDLGDAARSWALYAHKAKGV